MPIVSAALLNRPCWFDLSTSDLEAAKRLYGELFGWSFPDSGEELGHYTMAFAPGGHAVAALAPKMPGQEHIPSMWTVYFGVADADTTSAAIGAHGGPIPSPHGRIMVARDPQGAVISYMSVR